MREELELQFKRQLQRLRLLASSGPGNLKAAEGLASSAAEAIISAAGEQAMQLVELHQTSLLMRQDNPHRKSSSRLSLTHARRYYSCVQAASSPGGEDPQAGGREREAAGHCCTNEEKQRAGA
jgi:hypothetical protein